MAGRKKSGHGRGLRYEPVWEPIVRPARVEIDFSEAEEMLRESLLMSESPHFSPCGKCYDCGKQIGPRRKFCGSCLNKHQRHRR